MVLANAHFVVYNNTVYCVNIDEDFYVAFDLNTSFRRQVQGKVFHILQKNKPLALKYWLLP